MIHPERITLHHVRMPLVQPFETSFGRSTERDCILVEVQAGGLTGWGECVADREPGYAYETARTAWHIYADYLVPAALKAKVMQPGDIQAVFGFVRGHPMAKAGIEMALWDLAGKQEQRSLSSLLGGTRIGPGRRFRWDPIRHCRTGQSRRRIYTFRLPSGEIKDQTGSG